MLMDDVRSVRYLLACVTLASALTVTDPAAAQVGECASIIALSKVSASTISDRNTVEQHAANFCNEYSHAKSSAKSSSASASYKFFSGSYSGGRASMDDVAAKYCSASNGSVAAANAYQQYVETISPNAYGAYDKCLQMKRNVHFSIDPASILPNQFSMSVAFRASTASDSTAQIAVRPSDGVSCDWDPSDATNPIIMQSGTSRILDCQRTNSMVPGFVRMQRVDSGDDDQLVIPWQAYTSEGVPLRTLQELQGTLATLRGELDNLESLIASTTATANTTSSGLAAMRKQSTTVYRCPAGTDNWNPGGRWGSYGCQGQLSTNQTCTNIEYPHVQNRNCTAIGTMYTE